MGYLIMDSKTWDFQIQIIQIQIKLFELASGNKRKKKIKTIKTDCIDTLFEWNSEHVCMP